MAWQAAVATGGAGLDLAGYYVRADAAVVTHHGSVVPVAVAPGGDRGVARPRFDRDRDVVLVKAIGRSDDGAAHPPLHGARDASQDEHEHEAQADGQRIRNDDASESAEQPPSVV